MTNAEYESWLEQELQAGRIDEFDADDLREQRSLFEERRGEITDDFPNRVVGFVAGEMLVHPNEENFVRAAEVLWPGKKYYFETVGARPTEVH